MIDERLAVCLGCDHHNYEQLICQHPGGFGNLYGVVPSPLATCPEGYWPEGDSPPDSRSWEKSVQEFRADLQAMIDLVSDPETDLFDRIPHGDGQTILREALLVADHNAYHLGQMVFLRRCLGAWKG